MDTLVYQVPINRYNKVMLCYVTDCFRELHARGLCEMHYRRVLRKGNVGTAEPNREQRRILTTSDEDRFWSKVVKTDSCWLWTAGKTTAGYGLFQVNKKSVYIHRWAYEFFKQPIPEDLHIDHLCNTRNCVNPEHLEAVTIQENSRREWERIRSGNS